MPVLENRADISAVIVADEHGKATLLDQDAGRRMAEPPHRQGGMGQAPEMAHVARRTAAGERGVARRRLRPARSAPGTSARRACKEEREVYWTEPYMFFESKDPGITASDEMARCPASGETFVIALDVRLFDLSRFTSALKIGERGRSALLTNDGRVVGVPRHPSIRNDDDIKRADTEDAGRGRVRRSSRRRWRSWEAQGPPVRPVERFRVRRGGLARPLPLRAVRQRPLHRRDRGAARRLPARRAAARGRRWAARCCWACSRWRHSSPCASRAASASPLEALARESRRLGELDLERPIDVRGAVAGGRRPRDGAGAHAAGAARLDRRARARQPGAGGAGRAAHPRAGRARGPFPRHIREHRRRHHHPRARPPDPRREPGVPRLPGLHAGGARRPERRRTSSCRRTCSRCAIRSPASRAARSRPIAWSGATAGRTARCAGRASSPARSATRTAA